MGAVYQERRPVASIGKVGAQRHQALARARRRSDYHVVAGQHRDRASSWAGYSCSPFAPAHL